MGTVACVAGDAEAGAGPGRPAVPPSGEGVSAVSEAPGAVRAGFGVERRSPLVPVLVAVVVALIGGVFVFAAAGFNALRDDMNRGFAQMDSRFTQVDARFAQIDDRLVDINSSLSNSSTSQQPPRRLVGDWGLGRVGQGWGVRSGWRVGLGADAGVSPDDAEAADAVEVDGSGSPARRPR